MVTLLHVSPLVPEAETAMLVGVEGWFHGYIVSKCLKYVGHRVHWCKCRVTYHYIFHSWLMPALLILAMAKDKQYKCFVR